MFQMDLKQYQAVALQFHKKENLKDFQEINKLILDQIEKNNINIGQIDVDSNTINAFSEIDKIFLEEICELVSKNYVLNNN